jgi:hypothetical protein
MASRSLVRVLINQEKTARAQRSVLWAIIDMVKVASTRQQSQNG